MADEYLWQEETGQQDQNVPDAKSSSSAIDTEELANEGAGALGWASRISNRSSGWGWSSVVNVIKEKSTAALDVLTHDLSEFKETVSKDVATTALQVEEQVQEKVAPLIQKAVPEGAAAQLPSLPVADSLFDGLSRGVSAGFESLGSQLQSVTRSATEFLAPQAEEGSPQKPRQQFNSADRIRRETLQSDPMTYLSDPTDEDSYKRWRESTNRDLLEAQQHETLATSTIVAGMYANLVPADVEATQFWDRYFYKVTHLERIDRHRLRILQGHSEDEEENLTWDDDDEDDEPSSEQRQVGTEPASQSEGLADNVSPETSETWDVVEAVPPNESQTVDPEPAPSSAQGVERGNSGDIDTIAGSSLPNKPNDPDLDWSDTENKVSTTGEQAPSTAAPDSPERLHVGELSTISLSPSKQDEKKVDASKSQVASEFDWEKEGTLGGKSAVPEQPSTAISAEIPAPLNDRSAPAPLTSKSAPKEEISQPREKRKGEHEEEDWSSWD